MFGIFAVLLTLLITKILFFTFHSKDSLIIHKAFYSKAQNQPRFGLVYFTGQTYRQFSPSPVEDPETNKL